MHQRTRTAFPVGSGRAKQHFQQRLHLVTFLGEATGRGNLIVVDQMRVFSSLTVISLRVLMMACSRFIGTPDGKPSFLFCSPPAADAPYF